MNELLVGLNSEQQKAVSKLNGTLLVLAGAGSGKTKVLTQRIAYLVANGVHPTEILAVTFTNKAANEMRIRLGNILGEEAVKQMWVGTFHNICGRILRQAIEDYKTEDGRSWKSNFVIFDQDDSLSLIKQAIKTENLDDKTYIPKAVQGNISMAKNKMLDAFKFATISKDYRAANIARVYHTYEGLLCANNALDFDDLLLTTVNLFLKNPETLAKFYRRFSHILVDEFQDTNLVQYKMISQLYTGGQEEYDYENRSLCVVGDVDQSIYSWRGADCRILLNFQSDFRETELIKLEQNYRSTETILEVANKIIMNNVERLDKNLYSNKGKGEKVVCFEAQDEREEAFYVVNKILELQRTKRHSYRDCAVLYRTNAQSRAIEEALMAKNIPYAMVGGMKFYQRKEIKDMIAYLKLIYNSEDSQSLKRIVNVPKRSIGAATIKKLDDIAYKESISLFEVVEKIEEYADFTARTKTPLKEFARLINNAKSSLEKMPLSEFIAQLIEDTGYLEELKNEGTEEANGRIENLQEFISATREYENSETGNDLGEFLTQLALVSDIDELDDETEKVTLMTLHAAKGLEFPIVFLAGLEEGIFPHSRSLADNTEMEEERRLMYVGVTRAEDLLFISFAKRRLIWGDYKYFTPSRFLKEIPQHLLVSAGAKSVPKEQNDTSGKSRYSEDNTYVNYSDKNEPIKTGSFGKNFVAPKINKAAGKVSEPISNTGFGKNFVAPKIKKKEDAKEELAKKVVNIAKKVEEEPKFEVKPVKAPEVKSEPKVVEPEKTQKESFEAGTRVFHEKYGIGVIEQVLKTESYELYSVDFGKLGKIALDSNFANLKKF